MEAIPTNDQTCYIIHQPLHRPNDFFTCPKVWIIIGDTLTYVIYSPKQERQGNLEPEERLGLPVVAGSSSDSVSPSPSSSLPGHGVRASTGLSQLSVQGSTS